MLEYKPNPQLWQRVNAAILGENCAEVMVTLIGGMCSILIESGVCADARSARVHIAAMLLSPDGAPVGSLLEDLVGEFEKLQGALVVHVLHQGFPLCGFSDGTPNTWPHGHRWVRREELAQATCQKCVAAARAGGTTIRS